MPPLAASNGPFMSLTYDTSVISEVIINRGTLQRQTTTLGKLPLISLLFSYSIVGSLTSPSSTLGGLSNDDRDGNENSKKGIDKIIKTTTLHVHHAFLYISQPSLHHYNVKVPTFTFCRGREHKTTTFFFYSDTLIQSFRIQLPKNLPTFDELKEME